MLENGGLIDYIHDYIGADAKDEEDSLEDEPYSHKVPLIPDFDEMPNDIKDS